jgi:hypothetical protein
MGYTNMIDRLAWILTLFSSLGMVAAASADAPPAENGTSLTIYSSADPAGFNPQQFISRQSDGFNYSSAWGVPGFGVVKQVQNISMKKGLNEVPFTNVAQFLDPTTVNFKDLTDSGTSVLEQSFKFDLVSPSKLMGKYLDKEVTISVPEGDGMRTVVGTLLSANQGKIVVDTSGNTANGGLEILSASNAQIQLGSLPEGFLTKPTLVWLLNTQKAGEHTVRTTYQTGGLTWRADYNLVLNEDDTKADLTAWVTILNVSGMSYPNTNLKLVAGDVQRISPVSMRSGMAYGSGRGKMEMMADAPAGFSEKSFFEYHLYTLPRKTSILSNMTQQITLFPSVQGLTVQKELVYDPTNQVGWGREPHMNGNFYPASGKKVEAYVSFENKEKNKLGSPIPKGRIRAYKEDQADGTLEFIGEDLVDHTPRNEEVRIKLGNSFDIVGERTQTDFTIDKTRKTMSETIKIEIRNQKKNPQRVVVREHLYRWKNAKVDTKSPGFKKINSNLIEWTIDVAPEGKKTITYTVTYTW